MNRSKLLSIFMFVLFIVSILILTTCDKDPTGPTTNAPIASATIGGEGGKLETEGFSLQVPPGSFPEEVTLNLSISTEESGFGENSASETFIIEGIPADFEHTIRMAIKYDGALSDSSYMVITSTTEGLFSTDSVYAYHLLSVKDSSGYLSTNFNNIFLSNTVNKVQRKNAKIPQTNVLVLGKLITGMAEYKSDYFSIRYPNIIGEDGKDFAELMDDIFTVFLNDFGFDFKYNNTFDFFNNANWDFRSLFRINVLDAFITGILEIIQPIEIDKRDAHLKYYTSIDETLPSLRNRASLFMGRNLTSLLKTSYNFNFEESKLQMLDALTWWLEDYRDIATDNESPAVFEGYEMSLFGGFGNNSISPGLCSLIKYLVDERAYDVSNFGNIFEEAHSKNINHYYSLISGVNALIAVWFPDYYKKLINNEIYNIDNSVFAQDQGVDLIYRTWNIDSATEILKIFNNNFPDLSAKRYIVNLDYSDIDEDANLYLDATGNSGYDGIATLVFSVNNSGTLLHLVTAKNNATVLPKNLKAYYDEGIRKFLVVVVNSMHNGTDYLGNSDIELIMEVKKEEIVDYNYCSVSVRTNYDIHDDGTLWGANDFSADRTIDHGFNGNLVNGVFTGTAYPTDQYGNTYTGNISVDLNGSINNFSMELTENKYIENHSSYWGKNVTEVGNYKIKGGSGIQSISDSQYKVEGISTCSHLSENNFTRYLEIFNPYSGTLENTVNESSTDTYSCNGGSHISITFSKQ